MTSAPVVHGQRTELAPSSMTTVPRAVSARALSSRYACVQLSTVDIVPPCRLEAGSASWSSSAFQVAALGTGAPTECRNTDTASMADQNDGFLMYSSCGAGTA